VEVPIKWICQPDATNINIVSVPFVASAASNAEKNIVAAKQHVQGSKYPLWMYVTMH
jgi:hypothetical protein